MATLCPKTFEVKYKSSYMYKSQFRKRQKKLPKTLGRDKHPLKTCEQINNSF